MHNCSSFVPQKQFRPYPPCHSVSHLPHIHTSTVPSAYQPPSFVAFVFKNPRSSASISVIPRPISLHLSSPQLSNYQTPLLDIKNTQQYTPIILFI